MEAPLEIPRLRRCGRYVSVFDVMTWVTGKSLQACRKMWSTLLVRHPELEEKILQFKFNSHGRGSHQESPGADARTAVEIIMILPGEGATRFRQRAANYVVRLLGGDTRLIQEVMANRAAQERLDPSHPARIFGEAVEEETENGEIDDAETLENALLWAKVQKERAETENLRAQCLLATISAVELAGKIPGVEGDSRFFGLRRDTALMCLIPGYTDRIDAAEYLRLQGLTDEAIARLASPFSKLLRAAFVRVYGQPTNGKYDRREHRVFLSTCYEAFSRKDSFKRVVGDSQQRLREAVAAING